MSRSGDSEFPGVRRIPCQLHVDFAADIHPRAKSEVDAVWTVDEFLELLSAYAFTNFPDAVRRAFWGNRAEAVVEETCFQILGYGIVPATARSHCCLGCLPPLLSFPSAKFMVDVEELRSHELMPLGCRVSRKLQSHLAATVRKRRRPPFFWSAVNRLGIATQACKSG